MRSPGSAREAQGGRSGVGMAARTNLSRGCSRTRGGGHLERRARTACPPPGGRRAPAAAREPPGWELEAAREKSGARSRAAAAAEGLPRHLEACDSLRKAGGRRLQCAQSFGWRAKTQARAAAQSRASCGRNPRATPGGPHANSPTLGQVVFAPPSLA